MKRVWVFGSLLLAGCWPPSFFDYEDSAPVQVIEKPESFPSGAFGSALLALEDDSDGRKERLLVGSNAESPVYSFALTADNVVLPSEFETARLCNPESRQTDAVCEGAAVGSVLARVDVWGGGSLCAAIGGTGDAMVVACEDGASSRRFDSEDVNSQFGIAVAGIPGEARVLVGSKEDGAFVVGREDPEGASPARVDIGEDCAAPATGFGRAVAATEQFWAIGSSGSEIVVLAPDGAAFAVLETTAGGGATLVTADIVGDESTDLLAGGGGEVWIWDGDDLMDGADCADVPPVVTLSCSDQDGASCSERFGTSMAVGDVNDDGAPDLLVGDPGATVDGTKNAGAVWAYGGSSIEEGADSRQVLVDSDPEADQELGRAVAVASLLGRGEAIAGSKGEVFFFFCTGLSGDRPGDPGLDGCEPTP